MGILMLVNFALLTTFCNPLAAKLIVKPSDAEVKVNQSTYFNCSTDHGSTAIFWFHRSNYVYAGLFILEPYHKRFTIDRSVWNGTYIYNLVINSVQIGDAGQYSCAEDEGVGEKYWVQLVVLDDDPICRSNIELDEVIGENTCNVEPDEVELSCSITYHGNIPPKLEWKKDGDDRRISEGLSNITSSNHYIYILRLKADITLGKSSYVCQATGIVHEPYKCISKVINVLYAVSDNSAINKSIDDEIRCHANTTQSCNYLWRWFQNNDVTTESSSATLKPRKPGLHICEAECYLRNETCNLLAMRAMVYEHSENSQTRNVIISVVVSVVVTLVVVVSLICVFRRRISTNEDKAVEQKSGISNTLPESEPLRDADENSSSIADEPMQGFVSNEEIPMRVTKHKIKDIKEIPQRIHMMPIISKGSCGEIYGPFDFQDIQCACQQILLIADNVTCATEDDVCGPGQRWKSLDHNNVLKFYDVLFQYPAFYAMMDYAEGGSVRKTLNSCKEDLDVSVVHDWATQIADGMNYLHSQNIVHGGLKAAQVLTKEPFNPTNPLPMTLKIASYRLIAVDKQSVHASFTGMYAWMAPETIGGEQTRMGSDVWSYGVTVWEILTRAIPHKGAKQAVLVRDLCAGNVNLNVPSRCPDAIHCILKGCWEWDANRRSTFSEIVSRLHQASDALYENGT